MKRCKKCKEEKSLENFTRRKIYSDGLDIYCKSCKNKTKRLWTLNNKDKIKTYNKQTRYKYPYEVAKFRERKYGLTLEAYNRMLVNQEYNCGLCLEPLKSSGRICVDHDYITGKVRSILCIKCNTGLGMFNESAEALRNAADYLDNHRNNKGDY